MTVLGNHTIAETRDLMKVVENRFREVEKGFQQISSQYKAEHPDEYRLLALDWEKEKKYWNDESNAVSIKLTIMNASPYPADLIPAEPEYRRILGFVEYGAASGVERRAGDLRDCELRIEKALGRQLVYGRPDMTSSDADSAALKRVDASIKAGEAAAAAAKKGTWDAATSKNGLMFIGGAGAAVALYLFLKLRP